MTLKLAVVIATPDVAPVPPVALLNGGFAQRLDKARSIGYDGVELMVMQPAQLDALETRRLVAAAGLEIAAVASGALTFAAKLTLLHQDASVRQQAHERLHALIVFAAQVGAPLVTIGSFRGWLRNMPGDGWPYLIGALQSASGWAGEHGVRLVIEPLNRYEADAVATAEQALALIAEVGSPHLGLLLDTFHANIEEVDAAAAATTAARAGRLWHVHLGDSNRLPPGQGHFDFAGFVRALRVAGYDGYLSAELLARPDPDTAARQTAEHISHIFDHDQT
jgi:sugar phosphate isomerase/epimerase